MMDKQSFQDKRKVANPTLTNDIETNRIRNEITTFKIKLKTTPNQGLQVMFSLREKHHLLSSLIHT